MWTARCKINWTVCVITSVLSILSILGVRFAANWLTNDALNGKNQVMQTYQFQLMLEKKHLFEFVEILCMIVCDLFCHKGPFHIKIEYKFEKF